MKKIKIKSRLYQNVCTSVDDSDYDSLLKYTWRCYTDAGTGKLYVYRLFRANKGKRKGRYKYVKMHRQIMNAPKKKVVDHINGNTLDNRRSNLRVCTKAEDCRNVRKRKNTSSKYKGVTRDKNLSKWKVGIGYNGRRIFLGYYGDEEEAAKMYDEKAREIYGKFAALNFPKKGENSAFRN